MNDKLLVVEENVPALSNEEYALLRRNYLGASDASVYLGLQSKWKNKQDLIDEKCTNEITDEELAVGNKDVVRKGRDLEPLILQKAEAVLGTSVIKPSAMYAFKEYPYLSVNFDGVSMINSEHIPVEAKSVSLYGDKYYDRTKAIYRESVEVETVNLVIPKTSELNFIADVEAAAAEVGIPAYYYAQVQQQILALDAPYGYLAALHDKGWELCIYKVPRDEMVISQIIIQGYQTWQQIERRKTQW